MDELAAMPDARGTRGSGHPQGRGRFHKVVELEQALEPFEDGSTILFGGFGSIGTPPLLIEGLLEKGVKGLTLIGNDSGYPSHGVGRLFAARRVRRAVVSHIGSNPVAIEQMNEGTLELDFVPQGTLAERIRAGGAGLGGILVDVGMGTEVAEGRRRLHLDGREYLVEPAIRAPLGIVLAEYGDEFGNLVFPASARNFNPLVAMAADMVVAEVRQLVPCGELDPNAVHLPGVFVDRIVTGSPVPREVPVPRT